MRKYERLLDSMQDCSRKISIMHVFLLDQGLKLSSTGEFHFFTVCNKVLEEG